MTIFFAQSLALASDIYSHIVLELPYELRSDEPWVRIINTQEDLEQFYNELIADNFVIPSEAEPAPEIDFVNFQMIAGGLGSRSHGGYRLLIEKVFVLENEILINVLSIIPGDHCATIAAITYPSVAFLIRKTDKPIRFSVSELTGDCIS